MTGGIYFTVVVILVGINAFLALFWAYVGQPDNHIGWATLMPFLKIYSTSPRTNPWNFRKKILRIGRVEKLSQPFWYELTKTFQTRPCPKKKHFLILFAFRKQAKMQITEQTKVSFYMYVLSVQKAHYCIWHQMFNGNFLKFQIFTVTWISSEIYFTVLVKREIARATIIVILNIWESTLVRSE